MTPGAFRQFAEKIGLLRKVSMAAAQARPGSRIYLIGDSLTQRNYTTGTIVSMSRSNNVATVVTSSLSNLFPGCPFDIYDVPADFAGQFTMSSAAGSTFTYANPGPDVASFVPAGPFPRVANKAQYSSCGAVVWGNGFSLQKFDIVGMSANTGRLTSEMVARLPESASVVADLTVILGSTNDNNVVPVATAFGNLVTITQHELALGRKAMLTTIPPRAAPAWSAATAEFELEINKKIRAYARTTPGVYLWDIYKRLVDPVNANKGAGVAAYFASDGLHFSDAGAWECGDEFNIVTASWPMIDLRASSNGDNYGTSTSNSNYWDYGPWTVASPVTPTNGTTDGTGGKVAGIAQGFQGAFTNGTPTLVWSIVARTVAADGDAVGYNTQVVCTQNAANDQFQLYSNSSWTSRLPAGTVLQGECSVATSGIAAGKVQFIAHSVSLTIAGATGRLSGMASSGLGPILKDFKAVFRTPPVLLSTLPTAGFSQLLVGFSPSATGGAAVTIGAGRFQLRDPTK